MQDHTILKAQISSNNNETTKKDGEISYLFDDIQLLRKAHSC